MLLAVASFVGYLALVMFLDRFRVDQPSWKEMWWKTFNPQNYTPRGRKLLPLLYGTVALFAAGSCVMILRS